MVIETNRDIKINPVTAIGRNCSMEACCPVENIPGNRFARKEIASAGKKATINMLMRPFSTPNLNINGSIKER